MVPDLFADDASPRERVVFGQAGQGFTSFDALLKHPPQEADAVSDGDPFVIIHTAAIQGKPRGAVISHRNLVACSIQMLGALGLADDGAYLNILPLFHIGGLMGGLTMMQAGGRNVLLSRFDPQVAGKLIDREKVTFIGNFPPILTQLLDAQASGACSLSSLKHVFGLELPDTVKRFEGLGFGRFWLIYGQTETMGLTCLCPNSEKPGSAGRPGLLVELKIVDEFDRECAAGTPGEILIRGPLVFERILGGRGTDAADLSGGLAPHGGYRSTRRRGILVVRRAEGGKGADQTRRGECLPRRSGKSDHGTSRHPGGVGDRCARSEIWRRDQGCMRFTSGSKTL